MALNRIKKIDKSNKYWKHEIHDLFVESWEFVCEQKKFIYAVIGLFIAGSLIGFLEADILRSPFNKLISEIVDQTKGLDFLELFWFIFSNNITSSLSALFFGIFFGIFPLFHALLNGALLGYVYSEASALVGYGVIWRLFPHGIFELPAIFISLGLGVYIGSALFGQNKIQNAILRLKQSFRVFLTLVFALLVIAALIESVLIFYAG